VAAVRVRGRTGGAAVALRSFAYALGLFDVKSLSIWRI
jgi:hypothetical protein